MRTGRSGYWCLPHGLETGLIRPFSAEPDFQVGQNCQDASGAPGNAEVNPGGAWGQGEVSGAGQHIPLREHAFFYNTK